MTLCVLGVASNSLHGITSSINCFDHLLDPLLGMGWCVDHFRHSSAAFTCSGVPLHWTERLPKAHTVQMSNP